MSHCPPDLLDDLADVLQAVRTWPRVVERSPGVFYVGRTPFLHFHALRTGRVADARDGRDWGERIVLAPPVGSARRRALVRELARRHARTLDAFMPRAPGAGARGRRTGATPA